MEDETLTTAPMPFKSMLSFWKRLFRQSFHPLQASGHILCVALLPLVLVACSSPKPRELQPVVSNGWGEAKQVVIKKDLAELDLPLAIRELPRVEIEKTRRYLFMFERITMHFISTNTSNGSILSVRASFPKTSESNPYASLQMGVGKNAVLYTLSLGSPYCGDALRSKKFKRGGVARAG